MRFESPLAFGIVGGGIVVLGVYSGRISLLHSSLFVQQIIFFPCSPAVLATLH